MAKCHLLGCVDYAGRYLPSGMSILAATAAEAITITVFCTGSGTFRPPFAVFTFTVP